MKISLIVSYIVIFSLNVTNSVYPFTDFDEDEGVFRHCLCVPFWQCKEDLSGFDEYGIGIMDIRSKNWEANSPLACSGDLDVCCKVECGVRGAPIPPTINNHKKLEKRILGEHNTANFAEFPWMLGILKGTAYKCGASLIHPQVALTAAHCVYGRAKYTVRAGEWHWERTDEPLHHQDREVKQIIVHPEFHSGSLRNDIALLVLSEPYKLTQNVGIICLPPRKLKVDINQCVASGWGKNSYRIGTYQPVLKKVNLPIVPRNKCVTILKEAKLGPLFTLHGSFICAGGEPGKDTCKGDGGSPLICPIVGHPGRYQQVGIVSWGLTCGLQNSPGVYINVLIFSDWIDEEMSMLGFDSDIYRFSIN